MVSKGAIHEPRLENFNIIYYLSQKTPLKVNKSEVAILLARLGLVGNGFDHAFKEVSLNKLWM